MKRLLNVLKIALCLVAILGFVGCEQEPPAPAPAAKDYSATVSVESVELVTGESTTFTVKSTDGNWVIDETQIPDGISVTKADDGITYTVTSTGKTSIDSNLVFVETNTEEIKTLPVKVISSWVTLNFKFDDEVAAEISTLTVAYSTSVGSKEAEAIIAEDKKTATVLLDSSIYQSNWNGFNLKLTAKNASDEEIPLTYEGWITFEGTVAELAVEKYVASLIDITFTFVGFEIPGGSLSVTYGHNQDTEDDDTDDKFETIDAVVAEDGKSAIAQFNTDCAKGDYFNGLKVVAKDSEGNEIEGINLSATYMNYKEVTRLTVTKPSEEELAKWTELKTEATTFTGSYVNFVLADDFAGLTIKELKVEIANYAGSGWWANVSYMDDWANQIELAKGNYWSDEIKGYTVTFTNEDDISNYVTNGIYIVGALGDTATVTVSYTTE